jgi:hypothetical protein
MKKVGKEVEGIKYQKRNETKSPEEITGRQNIKNTLKPAP